MITTITALSMASFLSFNKQDRPVPSNLSEGYTETSAVTSGRGDSIETGCTVTYNGEELEVTNTLVQNDEKSNRRVVFGTGTDAYDVAANDVIPPVGGCSAEREEDTSFSPTRYLQALKELPIADSLRALTKPSRNLKNEYRIA